MRAIHVAGILLAAYGAVALAFWLETRQPARDLRTPESDVRVVVSRRIVSDNVFLLEADSVYTCAVEYEDFKRARNGERWACPGGWAR